MRLFCHKWFWSISLLLTLGVQGLSAQIQTMDPLEEPPPPNIPDTGQLWFEFIKMMFMLGIIIGFLLLIMWFIKRMMNARVEQLNESSAIKLVERRLLTPKTAIYVIEAENKRFILAESVNGVTSLGELK